MRPSKIENLLVVRDDFAERRRFSESIKHYYVQSSVTVVRPDTDFAEVLTPKYEAAGSRMFFFERDLALALGGTDLPLDLVGQEIPFPFECFGLELGGWGTWYVLRNEAGDPTTVLREKRGGASFAFPMHMRCGVAVDIMGKAWGEDEASSQGAQPGAYARVARDWLRAVLNCLLYIASPSAPIQYPDPSKISQCEARLAKARRPSHKAKAKAKLDRLRRIVVRGTHRSDSAETEEASGRSVSVRFRVRGHWRNQTCGPGHQQRRRIWIEPFWKGPDTADIVLRNYIVRGTDAE